MTDFLTPESEVLLKLLSNALFGVNNEITSYDFDPEKLLLEAKHQTVLAIAFDALPDEIKEKDSETYNKWQNYAFSIMQNNINQMYANAKLEQFFMQSGLNICTIKGFASAYYYAKKNLRQMGDIDFIVPVDKISNGKKILAEHGFECVDEEEIHDYHIGYKKDQYNYEMHKGITSFLDKNGYIEEYIRNIFTTSVKKNFGGVQITIPDEFAHGVIMLLHMQKHMIDGGGIGLRHLCDWAVFVNSFESSKWVNIFEEKLKAINLWKFAKAMSKVASVYLGMKEQDWFCDVNSALADELIYDITLGGNFGRKDIKRYQELMFVSQGNKNENKIKLFFNVYVKKVREWNSIFRKHKWLIFLGMLIYPFRTVLLVLLGKKRHVLSRNYESGNRRNSLYDKMFK